MGRLVMKNVLFVIACVSSIGNFIVKHHRHMALSSSPEAAVQTAVRVLKHGTLPSKTLGSNGFPMVFLWFSYGFPGITGIPCSSSPGIVLRWDPIPGDGRN